MNSIKIYSKQLMKQGIRNTLKNQTQTVSGQGTVSYIDCPISYTGAIPAS